jgi:hypothetical protein
MLSVLVFIAILNAEGSIGMLSLVMLGVFMAPRNTQQNQTQCSNTPYSIRNSNKKQKSA